MKHHPLSGSGLIKNIDKKSAGQCSKKLDRSTQSSVASVDLSTGGDGERQVSAWFLGPRAENLDSFLNLVEKAIVDHAYWRRNFHPEDPAAITSSIKREAGYLDAMSKTETELFKLLAQLKGSVPFSSPRYQGHMCWDQTMAGMVAYVAGMLYNQNNTATEASPVSTVLEYLVGQDLCRMFGYSTEDNDVSAWGHLTCGGTTANIEAQWSTRNAKYYPLAIKKAVASGKLTGVAGLTVKLPDGSSKDILDLNSWELLNISLDETLAMPQRLIEIMDKAGVPVEEAQELLDEQSSEYLLQNAGFLGLYTDELLPPVGDKKIKPPVYFVPASKHYSLPKGAAILGFGANQLQSISLDRYGRMDTTVLQKELEKCQANLEPVIGVTAVFGTTEEGTVDPLEDILNIRTELRKSGLDFAIHADGAWGGYFASMLSRSTPRSAATQAKDSDPAPVLPMSSFVHRQYELLNQADAITVDPHKTGYIPYPAGALCYRNKLIRNLVAFSAPYTNTSSDDDGAEENVCRPNDDPSYPKEDLVMGLYGIEGSKPGAAAAGVYLSHAVIPTDPTGYGTLLGRTLYNCKLFHLALLAMNEGNKDFYAAPVPHTSFDNTSISMSAWDAQTLLKSLYGKSYNEILNTPQAMDLLKEQGSDLNIICFAFNFRDGESWNKSLAEANKFNQAIYERCSVQLYDNIHDYEFVTSATSFAKESYGDIFFKDYAGRLLKVAAETEMDDKKIAVMRSVIMDPWLTESRDGKPFLNDVVDELKAIVCEVFHDMVKTTS